MSSFESDGRMMDDVTGVGPSGQNNITRSAPMPLQIIVPNSYPVSDQARAVLVEIRDELRVSNVRQLEYYNHSVRFLGVLTKIFQRTFATLEDFVKEIFNRKDDIENRPLLDIPPMSYRDPCMQQ